MWTAVKAWWCCESKVEELTCLIHRGNRALQVTSHSCSCSGCQSHQGLCPISSHLESGDSRHRRRGISLGEPSIDNLVRFTWSESVNSGSSTGLPLLIATSFAVKSAWVGMAKNEINDPNPLKLCEPNFVSSSSHVKKVVFIAPVSKTTRFGQ